VISLTESVWHSGCSRPSSRARARYWQARRASHARLVWGATPTRPVRRKTSEEVGRDRRRLSGGHRRGPSDEGLARVSASKHLSETDVVHLRAATKAAPDDHLATACRLATLGPRAFSRKVPVSPLLQVHLARGLRVQPGRISLSVVASCATPPGPRTCGVHAGLRVWEGPVNSAEGGFMRRIKLVRVRNPRAARLSWRTGQRRTGPNGPRRGLLLLASPQRTGALHAITVAGYTAALCRADR
jgi:hypothetical protein